MEKAALRNPELTRKVTLRYPDGKAEYVIFTRPSIQVVPWDTEARRTTFPEIHNLIELDRERQMNARTITPRQFQEARAGKAPESVPAPAPTREVATVPRGRLPSDQVLPNVPSAKLEEILNDLNIKYVKTAGRMEGVHFYDFERKNVKIRLHNYQGRDLWIDAVFTDPITLEEINQWNVRSRFSRAVLVKDGDKPSTSLEAQLDCTGGATEGMIRQFILRFDDDITQFVKFLTR